MSRIPTLTMSLVLAAGSLFSTPQSADSNRVQIPGTKVSMIPPDGFELADDFSGFIHEASKINIVVEHVPSPMTLTRMMLEDERIAATNGMVILGKEAHIQSATLCTSFLFHMKVRDDPRGIHKWIYVLGDSAQTFVVKATYLSEHDSIFSSRLRSSVLSAQWDNDLIEDPLSGFLCVVDGFGGFRAVQRMGNAVFFAKPDNQSLDFSKELFIVETSTGQLPVSNPDSFLIARDAKWRIQLGVDSLHILERIQVTIGGLPGFSSIITGVGQGLDEPFYIHETILFDMERHYKLTGTTRGYDSKASTAAYKQMANSFRKR